MRVAVVGGGASGTAIHRALTEHGAKPELFSRTTGFDVLRDDAPARLAEAEVIVEATGRFTISRRAATEFFTRSTRAVAAAARASGARHILLSIVNGDLPQVQGYGYLAGKTAQERVARQESPNLTIVRSTQWFEFAGQNIDRMKIGPIALVPAMTIQPVALDAVADVIADAATGVRTGALHEVAGPEATTLWDMTTQLSDKRVTPIPLRIPSRYGRAFRDGTLLPAPGIEVAGPRYTEWLNARSA
ncbi:NADH(P)-binding protein [Compostimonas suwonensis]|uniref:dTDP-4-dehydrorhamnose reductase n=1 Tax=Compostimonas suwonensis TaxID=1048394 RepID=A0A2M9BBQ3_9MICO|nr:NADH(P)-binding protein [Compostimonas suwonensis]PJJ55379.1 dTDP-4-dehydrorhamnose reductase [Compostimonas suwonensis]